MAAKPIWNIRLLLTDTRHQVTDAWSQQFNGRPYAKLAQKDILLSKADAILLPGNSFGFLDTGLEMRVCDTLGLDLQDELRHRIRKKHDGELLVGQALVLQHASWTIAYAPVWRTPQPIAGSINPFLCVRAGVVALRQEQKRGKIRIASVAIPGVGVGSPGEMHPLVSARQVRYGFETAVGARSHSGKNLSRLIRRELKLKAIPPPAEPVEDEPDDDTAENGLADA